MGLWSEKAVSAHLLLENAYESNLVSDISKVDYLAGSLGRTHLRPLPGLPTFVDDVYVFGYLRREDCVFQGGGLSCTTGEDSSAKHTIARISTAVRECMGTPPDGTTRGYMQANIVHTIAARDNAEGGAIRATVSRIEYDTGKKAQAKWRELYPDTEPAGLFVAKVDVSEIPMDELQASLPAFERLLLAHGYGIYLAFASKATWRPPCAQMSPRYWRTPIALGAMSAHGCAQAKLGTRSERRRTTRSYRTSRRTDSRTNWWPPSRLCWLPERPSAVHLLASRRRGQGLHSHRSLSVRLPRGRPLGEYSQRGGGGGLGPGFPLWSARPVCSPTARQAVGEPGRVPRPVPRPSWPAAGLDLRSLVRAHDNRPGLGSLGPTNQGTRRQRGNMGEGRRMGRGRLRVQRLPHLPGRHSGSQRGGRRAGTAPMLFQGRRCRHNLGG